MREEEEGGGRRRTVVAMRRSSVRDDRLLEIFRRRSMTAIFAKCSHFRGAFERSEVRRECSISRRIHRTRVSACLVESAERKRQSAATA